MQNRLSIADLKAKSNTSIIANAEMFMGGNENSCHNTGTGSVRSGSTNLPCCGIGDINPSPPKVSRPK